MDNIKKDRDIYIGGSDIPIILGISPFKSRNELLLEKLGKRSEFEGNAYTEYGNKMEPKIRNYVNESGGFNFVENSLTLEDKKLRANVDGVDFTEKTILEIKTSGDPQKYLKQYKSQLLFYMYCYDYEEGGLALYTRMDFNNFELDPFSLEFVYVNMEDEQELMTEILEEVEKFQKDLEDMKTYKSLGMEPTQDDIIPVEVRELSLEIQEIEEELQLKKYLENRSKELKEVLLQEMKKHNIKKWETSQGTKITLVKGKEKETSIVEEFNKDKFIADYFEGIPEKQKQEITDKYTEEKEVISSSRKDFVKITLSKE